MAGAHAGAVGSVPLIVRQSPADPRSAVLVQVPVNTWEAYNRWGGKSLYQFGTSMHAFEVSFDRPYDQQVFYNMVTELELPWVRFLERNGIDVSYQTDVDTDRAPGSLLHHRLVFAIGHDEYWTQRMRGAFDRGDASPFEAPLWQSVSVQRVAAGDQQILFPVAFISYRRAGHPADIVVPQRRPIAGPKNQ